jgi:predicted ATPase
LVLRGRGVSGGGLPYQLFREPLRRLMLNIEISDRDAGIISDIVPDVAELLDRIIPVAPPVEDANHQQRLISTITSLFQKNPQPTVLIMEDLQWAQESLHVLRALNEMVSQLPLLIVGNFRQEEHPTLPEELPDMHYIKLERLTKDSVFALTESMLGEAGRQQHLLELLHRETEGNALFLVEVVRTLADEAGRLEDIGRITLPQHVLAGGIQNVIKLRLDQVPQWGRNLLQLAAIAGRDLDLDVLEQLKGDVNLETWLTVCANSAVLEIHDGRWTFAHEKLREAGSVL